MSIDMSQFYQVFFEEAEEHLANMESLLLDMDVANPNLDDLNAIFRAAHSIKGGSGTFGFNEMTEVTHILETLLDRLRKSELQPTTEMIDVFLRANDVLKGLLQYRRNGTDVDEDERAAVCAALERLSDGDRGIAAPPASLTTNMDSHTAQDYFISVDHVAPDQWTLLLEDLQHTGTVSEPQVEGSQRRFRLTSSIPQAELLDIFAFFVQPNDVRIGPNAEAIAPAPVAQEEEAYGFFVSEEEARSLREAEQGYGFFDEIDEDGAEFTHAETALAEQAAREAAQGYGFFDQPDNSAPAAHSAPTNNASPGYGFFAEETELKAIRENAQGYGFFQPIKEAVPTEADASSTESPTTAASNALAATAAPTKVAKPAAENKPSAAAANNNAETSIRVSVEKVDQLINLVGELVITQAMLAQTASELDPVLQENLLSGIALLERNTRDLQEAVMSIRMLPMSFVFSRFPRLVRDLAGKLGKDVQLKTVGEGTELDKGLIEKITDPLTHLVRNSLDHGIEKPEVRREHGKLAKGTLTLRAFHQGGNVVIEVQDDGGGLNRQKILDKAKERGLAVSEGMLDQDVWQLIFAPGFSTADQITDVSGRGVGMDVVKRNIESLGGRVEIDSAPGYGTTITIRLPLTLAILDGLSIAVGEETYIIPLTSIIESLQPSSAEIKPISGQGWVVHVRGEYLPLVTLHDIFATRPRHDDLQKCTLMIVEADGSKAALLVDDLLGQHQVVIKSLETNYRRIAGISGATIMGDGQVALILDVAAIIRLGKTTTNSTWSSGLPHVGTSVAQTI